MQSLVFSGAEASVADASMEQQDTGHVYDPAMHPGTLGNASTDSPEEEPPLLEGTKTFVSL